MDEHEVERLNSELLKYLSELKEEHSEIMEKVTLLVSYKRKPEAVSLKKKAFYLKRSYNDLVKIWNCVPRPTMMELIK